ncbi:MULTISPECIES: YlxR family protein [Subtercola]|uniref:YlxR family protein n=1 Tax=Subtercola vilae TaxID=2056433 RepID=A0A4T2BI44_9MICO|nr:MULTISPECIES: YlxR family protein [Subtercola]MEA9986735.1 YlxR family protein [Subtercola sp. RTI3]TIH31193.1 YlxR family protein [Subtercola vilae]
MKPVRTCVGCRARAEKSSLLRVVAQNLEIVADEAAVLPGRGAYLHPSVECFQKAVKRRAFGRALRTETPLETAALGARLTGLAS